MPVDVAEGQHVHLVLHVGAEPVHEALDDSGEHVRRDDRDDGRARVEPRGLVEDPVELVEVDAALGDQARDDHVGRAPQHARAQYVQHDCGDGKCDHDRERCPIAAQHPQ